MAGKRIASRSLPVQVQCIWLPRVVTQPSGLLQTTYVTVGEAPLRRPFSKSLQRNCITIEREELQEGSEKGMCEVVVANFSLSVIFDAGTLRMLNL